MPPQKGICAVVEPGVRRRRVDPEIERSRLVWAMKESGTAWPFDHATGRTLWEGVLV